MNTKVARQARLLPLQRAADPELVKLIAKITPKNRHGEADWGMPVGRERF